MKKQFLFASLAFGCAFAADIPEKLYLNQETEHKTTIFKPAYVEKIGIVHSGNAYDDSLVLEKSDGLDKGYLLREVDSITFYAPSELMRAHIEYQDANYAEFYPTYVDNYIDIAGWDSRSEWNLSNVHDPTVMKADDGYYYMYQTDASYGNAHEAGGSLHGRRSRNLIDWEYLGGTITEAPGWILDSVNAYRSRMGTGLSAITEPLYGFWAPSARKVESGLYRMYYSVVVDNYIGSGEPTSTGSFDYTWTERAFIGLMETSDPSDNSSWVDKGFVICSSTDKDVDYYRASTSDYDGYFKFNAIDPSFIITPEGEHWLVYGSWHSGIVVVQLDPETGKTLEALPDPWGSESDIEPYGKLIATRDLESRWQGSEGPEVVYNPETGYYYLFMAYDALAIPYNTRVLRSKSVDGPYVGMDGNDITANGGESYPVVTHPYAFNDDYGWVGISHCAVWDDGEGEWFFSSQGRLPENVANNAYSNAIMLGQVRKIYWTSDGWPVVSPERYGGTEEAPIEAADLAGTWEVVDLAYSYGKQKTSSSLTIAESGGELTLSGAISGTATFDSSTNIMSISASGGSFEVNVARELDWEISPRQATIVFAGYPSATSTYWAKRVGE